MKKLILNTLSVGVMFFFSGCGSTSEMYLYPSVEKMPTLTKEDAVSYLNSVATKGILSETCSYQTDKLYIVGRNAGSAHYSDLRYVGLVEDGVYKILLGLTGSDGYFAGCYAYHNRDMNSAQNVINALSKLGVTVRYSGRR